MRLPRFTNSINLLKGAYLFVLASIAILAVTSFLFLTKYIKYQENSSHVINISGRQRMLSQRITKNLLILNNFYSNRTKSQSLQELAISYNAWRKAHISLQYGNFTEGINKVTENLIVNEYFKRIDKPFQTISYLCQKRLKHPILLSLEEKDITLLLKNEKLYLSLMDQITYELDSQTKKDIQKLSSYELIFLGITLFTLMIEAIFIFRPISNLLQRNLNEYQRVNQELSYAIKTLEKNDSRLIEEQRNSIQQIVMAEENERRRIAADLHDSLGQLIVSLKIQLEDITILKDIKNDKITLIVDQLNLIANEIRVISNNLMPATLSEFGIGDCIEQYISKIKFSSAANIIFYFDRNNAKRVEPIREILIYRVSQELLNNAIKHSFAKEIIIQLLFHSDNIVLMVEDDGIGYDFEKKFMETNWENSGLGLRNIKTRIESIGGTFTVDTSKNHGTTSIIQIPYQ
jgi:signal transduction histidine kinase